ncbi:MAG: type 4a pilus biogenesis protein PilO [Phycisphaerales bacterium]
MEHSEYTASRLSNTKFVVIWVTLVAAVVGALLVPKFRSGASLETEIAEIQSDIDALSASDEVIIRLATIRDELASFGEGRVRVIPARNDVAGLMTQLSDTFEAVGLEGREMTSQTEVQIDDVVKMPMVVRVSGEFPQIYDVVRRLEHLPRLVRIGRLRIEKDGAKSRTGVTRESTVTADILIEAFYEDTSGKTKRRGAK